MREIKFRAKAINRVKGRQYRTKYKNGDWVYGLLEKHKNDYHCAEMINENEVSGIDVDEETLGQFTGLYDKNGIEIYGGDIISANHYPFVDNDKKQNYVGVIEYIPELASFQYILHCVNPDKNGISNGINEQLEANENLILEDFEVIGNIYDNPELIGE